MLVLGTSVLFQGTASVGKMYLLRQGAALRGLGYLGEGLDSGERAGGWLFAIFVRRQCPLPWTCRLLCTSVSSVRGLLGEGFLRRGLQGMLVGALVGVEDLTARERTLSWDLEMMAKCYSREGKTHTCYLAGLIGAEAGNG